MRNISFALTEPQILAGTKTVTRRLGWETLKAGTLLRPVRKGMGLKKGEKVHVLRDPIRVIEVSREPLDRLLWLDRYPQDEVEREGFPDMAPSDFVAFFMKANGLKTPCSVTRIQFEFTSNSEPKT